MPDQPKCPMCNGTLHIIVNGMAKRCKCVIRTGIINKRIQSGIPQSMVGRSTQDFIDNADGSVRTILKRWIKQRTTTACLYRASVFNPSRLETECMVAAVAIAKGMTAARIRLSEIIDHHFDQERKRDMQARLKSDAVVIVLDKDAPHKMIPAICGDILSSRTERAGFTLYATSDELITQRSAIYGATFVKYLDGLSRRNSEYV